MQTAEFRLPAHDGEPIFVRAFLPETEARAAVQIAHGLAEHSGRYARLAAALTDRGYAVYANDHRGHGHTVQRPEDLGYFKDRDGYRLLVQDAGLLLDEIKSRHESPPVFLLGHSMGSYIARSLAFRRGHALAGLILSGTTHDHPLAYRASRLLALAEGRRLGRRGRSELLYKMTFGAFAKKIPNARTPFDWLSRDPLEVDKYIADELCGFSSATQLWVDLLGGLIEICEPSNIAQMPKTLPIYILAGELDPVHREVASIRKLHSALEAAHMDSVTVRIYPSARHELFNETNREEVTRDLLAWLDEQLS